MHKWCMRDGIECFLKAKKTAHTSFPEVGQWSLLCYTAQMNGLKPLKMESPIDRQLVGDGTEDVP